MNFFPFKAATCVPLSLVLAFIPHFFKAYLSRTKLKREGSEYDPRRPRVSQQAAADDSPTGQFLTRCIGCHQNGLEAFSFLSAAVALSIATGVPVDLRNKVATYFLATRVVYTWIYLTGEQKWKGWVRSLVWLVGMSEIACLFVSSVKHSS